MEPPNFLCSAPRRVAEVHGFQLHIDLDPVKNFRIE